jgi:FtsZ-interacting cell division protein ZipA
MNATIILILIIVAVVALAIGAAVYFRRRRTENLRSQFGPEYKSAVDRYGDQAKAEGELAAREKRVRKLEIRALTAEERARFTHSWKKTQAYFVDEPSRAVREADGLVKQVMQTRGYPVADFEQRAADISVDHPNVVANYRSAHDIAQRNDSGKATTEDLRQAIVHYRSLFEELLDTQIPTIHEEAV